MNGAMRTIEDNQFHPCRLPVISLAISDVIFIPMPGSHRRRPLHILRTGPPTSYFPRSATDGAAPFRLPRIHPFAGLSWRLTD